MGEHQANSQSAAGKGFSEHLLLAFIRLSRTTFSSIIIAAFENQNSNFLNHRFHHLQDLFPAPIYNVYIINPGNFWQKQKTSLGSHKYKFETSLIGIEELMKKVGNEKVLMKNIICDADG